MNRRLKIINIKFISLIGVVFSALYISGCSIHHVPFGAGKNNKIRELKPLTQNDALKVAHIATSVLGKQRVVIKSHKFRADCSGTVRGVFAKARVNLGGILKSRFENDVKGIYRYVKKYGKVLQQNPRPGDLVFFHNTYDRSRNGKMNDALTHIGIVERVQGDQVIFIHHLGKIIIRSRMNLKLKNHSFHPQTKVRVNHILRRAQGKFKAYNAAQLFAGFGRL